ncbi:MAG: class I SAM-dependent methyltransferase [Bauldia sp.]|nr:class I SAM-dependent methyltransferase [Bauldia sp.]
MLPDDFRFPTPTRENLPRLARIAFDTGAVHCRGCRDYHLTWPYLRAMGLNGAGPEFNLPLHVEMLGRVAAGRRDTRWLLAGSADAGVLAAVQETIAALPPAGHDITVLDRCPTPLALCRDHAESTGLAITTVAADLMSFDPPKSFDVILGHQVVLFFRDEDRPALYRRLASWLAPSGRLCLTVANQTPTSSDTADFHADFNRWRVGRIRAEAAAGTIDLPEDVEIFVARMDRRLERINKDARFGIAHYVRQLEEAGLAVIEATPMPDADQTTEMARNGRNRHLIVAELRGA